MSNLTGDLFDSPLPQNHPLADLPRSRRDDPETSHLAAEAVKKSGRLAVQQKVTLQAVRDFPGLTCTELAHGLTFTDTWKHFPGTEDHDWRFYHDFLHKRLPELIVFVKKGEPRKCMRSGRMALTWWPK